MKNLKSFNESFNTYSKYDRWEVKPDVDVYDSDWKNYLIISEKNTEEVMKLIMGHTQMKK